MIQHYCFRDILNNLCQKYIFLGICLNIVHHGFQPLRFYMNIMSHVKYLLFCSLVCHIICFYFNIPEVLHFDIFASCCATEDWCRSIYISDFGCKFAGFANASSCALIAYNVN